MLEKISPQLLLIAGGVASVLVMFLVSGRIPLRYNLRNLMVRWRTTLLTALAFTLVIALLIVMLAFVNGMNRLTEGSGRPGNVIVLSAGVTDEAFSNLGFSDTGDIENQPGILRVDGQPLCSKETYLVINQPKANPPASGPKRRFLQIRGLDDPQLAARVHGVELYEGGRWFSAAGVQQLADSPGEPAASPEAETAIEVVLGEGVARELSRDRTDAQRQAARLPDRLDVGEVVPIGGRKWIVVGILKSSGSTFDSELWTKRSLVAALFGKNTYSSLVVRAESPAQARKLKDYFNNDYKKAALQALLETEYYASLARTNQQFAYAVSVVALIMGLGGVFGVMNTMFAAISQRVKDIGVMRMLGYARWQILLSFLIESLVLALFGGALGCLLGMLADGWSATSIVSSGAAGKSVVLKLAVDGPILLQGLLLTLTMGLIGGLIPSLAAMRLRPLEALR